MSRKLNQKDYKWYVLLDGSIESGWEFEQDARDQWKEVKRMNVGSYPIVHVFSKRHLISLGTNPDDNKNWYSERGLSCGGSLGCMTNDAITQAISDLETHGTRLDPKRRRAIFLALYRAGFRYPELKSTDYMVGKDAVVALLRKLQNGNQDAKNKFALAVRRA